MCVVNGVMYILYVVVLRLDNWNYKYGVIEYMYYGKKGREKIKLI